MYSETKDKRQKTKDFDQCTAHWFTSTFMNKYLFNSLFLFLFITSFSQLSFSQQIPFEGVVKIHNSKFETGQTEYVQFATVTESKKRAQSSVTDAQGSFKLILVGVEADSSFQFKVEKGELEVVNFSELKAVAGQKEKVEIYMAEPKYVADFRNKIYQVGKTSAEKALEKRQEQLMAELAAEKDANERNEEKIISLSTELSNLFLESTKIKDRADYLADKYERVNLDIASDRYLKAFRFFQEGNLEEAKSILSESKKTAEKIFAEREKIKQIKAETAQREADEKKATKTTCEELRLKADMHFSEGEWDSVTVTYNLILNLDSNTIEHLYEAAYFLSRRNEHNRAIRLFEKALEQTENPSIKSNILLELSLAYQKTLDFEKASEASFACYEIRRKLAEADPETFLPSLAAPLNNLGNQYAELYLYDAAEMAYQEALNISWALAQEDPERYTYDVTLKVSNMAGFYFQKNDFTGADSLYRQLELFYREAAETNEQYRSDHAGILNNLANVARKRNQYKEGEKFSREAVTIKRELIEENRAVHLPDLAENLNTLGAIVYQIKINEEAEEIYLEALRHFRELSKVSPDAFQPKVALVLNNLGNVLAETEEKRPQAELAYQESLNIYREVARRHPTPFLSDVAMALNNLGYFHVDFGDPNLGEKEYREAISIYRNLAKENPDLSQPDYVTVLKNMAYLEYGKENWTAAIEYFKEALTEQEKLMTKSPAEHQSTYTYLLKDLGLTYLMKEDYKNSTDYYLKALPAFRNLAENNPDEYNLEIANIAINLGIAQQAYMETSLDFSHKNITLEILDEAKAKMELYRSGGSDVQHYFKKLDELKFFFTNADPISIPSKKLILKIQDLEGKISNERKPSAVLPLQKEIVDLEKQLFELKPDDLSRKELLASGYGSLAWVQLQNNNPEATIDAADNGLKLIPEEFSCSIPLALAHLRLDKWKKAKSIIEKNKRQKINEDNSWGDVFLYMMNILEKGGMTFEKSQDAKDLLE